MSEDKEKEIVEATRRNQSERIALTGNLFQIKRKGGKSLNNEKDVKNPLTAILIVVGSIGATWLVLYIILSIIEALSN